MAVSLVGEVVNQCDDTTGFNTGNQNTDIYIEPTASVGAKVSGSTQAFYTTSLGASSPYNFSTGGGQEGFHIIIWMNGLTPVDGTAGMRITVGDSVDGDRGEWYVPPSSGYTGGFISRVVDTAANFDLINEGAWTSGGNPGQLNNIDEMGGTFQTTTSIMGNFSNVLIDQFTIGEGIRVDGGSSSSPNTFETVRSADEDTNYWGWWTSSVGAYIGKGKLFIGPASGTNTSVFEDSANVVLFAGANVAAGFYEFKVRGSNTTVNWDGMVIRAEAPSTSRWSLTLDGSSIPSFTDTGSLFQGFRTLLLRSSATLSGTTLDDGITVTQNGATIKQCSVLNSSAGSGNALIASNNPGNISNCDFTFSSGHAIEITSTGTYTFDGNSFSGYGADGTNTAAIYNNSGGSATLNITGGGSTPTVRNGSGASTTINNVVTFTISNIQPDSEVRIYEKANPSNELAGSESVSGGLKSFTFVNTGSGYASGDVLTLDGGTFTTAAEITVDSVDGTGAITAASISTAGSYTDPPSAPVTLSGGSGSSASINPNIRGTFSYQYNYTQDTDIIIIGFHLDFKDVRLTNQTLTSNDQSIPIQQSTDRVYSNPA